MTIQALTVHALPQPTQHTPHQASSNPGRPFIHRALTIALVAAIGSTAWGMLQGEFREGLLNYSAGQDSPVEVTALSAGVADQGLTAMEK